MNKYKHESCKMYQQVVLKLYLSIFWGYGCSKGVLCCCRSAGLRMSRTKHFPLIFLVGCNYSQ